MQPQTLAALGAFLSGAGSVLGAWYAIRTLRRRMRADCDERLEILVKGVQLGHGVDPTQHRDPDR